MPKTETNVKRLMVLAGLTPPATLSVVPGTFLETRLTSLPSLNYSLPAFSDVTAIGGNPSAEVLQIASRTAQSIEILPATPPATNSSYHQQFFGPSVRCSPANTTQQPFFDHYSTALGHGDLLIATKETFEGGNLSWTNETRVLGDPFMLVFSAFAPFAGYNGWLVDEIFLPTYIPFQVDRYNNWVPDLPNNFYNFGPPNYWNTLNNTGKSQNDDVVQQLWVQTADQSLVCLMGNATFDVQSEYIDGTRTMLQYTTSNFEPFFVPQGGVEDASLRINGTTQSRLTLTEQRQINSYMAHFLAFTSTLNGNITMTLMDNPENIVAGTESLYEESSNILQVGLSACDDFVHGYWDQNAIAAEPVDTGSNKPVIWSDAASFQWINVSNDSIEKTPLANITNNLFDRPAWMCRNRTLARAIEDLANNITISMLSSSKLMWVIPRDNTLTATDPRT